MLFLTRLHLNRDGTCTDFDVREGKPNGRTVAHVYKDFSAGGQWCWCLNESRTFTGCHAPTRAKAMLLLKQRWLERGPVKPGDTQLDTPEWTKNRPEHQHVVD